MIREVEGVLSHGWHVAAGTSCCFIDRTNGGMLLHGKRMTPQTRIDRRFGDTNRILMRIMAIDARHIAAALNEALAIAQSRDLARHQNIFGNRIRSIRKPGVAPGANRNAICAC